MASFEANCAAVTLLFAFFGGCLYILQANQLQKAFLFFHGVLPYQTVHGCDFYVFLFNYEQKLPFFCIFLLAL